MTDNRRLQDAFKFVKETFFPRWDTKNEWVVKEDSHLRCAGWFKPESKEIFLGYTPEDDEKLYELLIHEICHFTGAHGKKFQLRMLKAADDAKKFGFIELANLLYNHVEEIKNQLKSTDAERLYDLIGEAVIGDPNLTFDEIINYVSQIYGMYPDEFKESFKQCKKFYEKAKRLHS